MLINYLCEPGPWTPPVARYCRSGSERTLRCLLTWPCWAVTSHNIDQSDQSSRSLRPGTQCNQNYSWKHQANRYILKIPANESVTMKYLTIILFKLVEKNTTSNDDFVFLCFTTPLKKRKNTYFWWVSMLKFSSNSTCTVSVAGTSMVHTQSTLWG